jgi:hypothetical protein
MADMFTFTVPGGFWRTEEIIALKRRIQATGKPVRIQTYDTVQGLQWNGGRLTFTPGLVQKEQAAICPFSADSLPEAVERVRYLNREGIGFHLAFNNILESLDVEDEAGNYLLQNLHHEMNGVTIATRALWRHITANFPKFERTASICFVLKGDEQYRKACGEFEKVVALPTMAYEPERLRGLPLDQLVFIANDECYLFCLRKDHYAIVSRCSMSGNSTRSDQVMNFGRDVCLGKGTDYWERTDKLFDQEWAGGIWRAREQQLAEEGFTEKDHAYLLAITPATRRNLIQLGVRNFKLQGREYNNASYQGKVIEFLERMVRDEI